MSSAIGNALAIFGTLNEPYDMSHGETEPENPISEDMDKALDDLYAELDDMKALSDLKSKLNEAGGISQGYAAEAFQLIPEMEQRTSLRHYTTTITRTNYKLSMEAIDLKMGALIAAGVAALAALLWKFISWIRNKFSGDGDGSGGAGPGGGSPSPSSNILDDAKKAGDANKSVVRGAEALSEVVDEAAKAEEAALDYIEEVIGVITTAVKEHNVYQPGDDKIKTTDEEAHAATMEYRKAVGEATDLYTFQAHLPERLRVKEFNQHLSEESTQFRMFHLNEEYLKVMNDVITQIELIVPATMGYFNQLSIVREKLQAGTGMTPHPKYGEVPTKITTQHQRSMIFEAAPILAALKDPAMAATIQIKGRTYSYDEGLELLHKLKKDSGDLRGKATFGQVGSRIAKYYNLELMRRYMGGSAELLVKMAEMQIEMDKAKASITINRATPGEDTGETAHDKIMVVFGRMIQDAGHRCYTLCRLMHECHNYFMDYSNFVNAYASLSFTVIGSFNQNIRHLLGDVGKEIGWISNQDIEDIKRQMSEIQKGTAVFSHNSRFGETKMEQNAKALPQVLRVFKAVTAGLKDLKAKHGK